MVRKKWVLLTPEEHVRQLLVHYLVHSMGYPQGVIALEKSLLIAGRTKRFDMVVYSRNHVPWMLIECKAPEVAISEHSLVQALHYHSLLQAAYIVLCNGIATYCAKVENGGLLWQEQLPYYGL